jgi:3-oxoacyl-[acyl-carrier-protein] synthase-3
MSLSTFKNVKVSGMVTVVPENHINIDDEIEFYENSRKKLERNKKILGLGTRHVVEKGTTMFELCEEAASILIDEMGVDKNEIDTLIFASINHDYNGNADACILQGNLDLSEECACLDTSGLGCTDIPYGLWLAHSLVQSGASKKCLFVEGSLSSLITDKKNRNSNMLFGDAGAAVLLEPSVEERPSYFHLMSRGKDWKCIATPAGGFRLPVREDMKDIELEDPMGNPIRLWDSVMDGNAVFRFATQTAPYSVEMLLKFAGQTKDDVDFFALHQANGQIVRTIINHGGIPKDKATSNTFTKYGNCGGTSVLVNLCDELKERDAENIVMVSFGVGLSTASCLLNVKETYNGGVRFYKSKTASKSRKDLIQEWSAFITNKED